MLHGFGVGSWHFHRNWEDLQHDHRVWAVDLLGQGECAQGCFIWCWTIACTCVRPCSVRPVGVGII